LFGDVSHFLVFVLRFLYVLQRSITLNFQDVFSFLSQFEGNNGLAMSPTVYATRESNSGVSMVSMDPMVWVYLYFSGNSRVSMVLQTKEWGPIRW